MRLIAFAISLLLAASAAAAEPMSAEEFDAFTLGKTFYYGVDGRDYGAEEYHPGRRVIWTFLDGRCDEGVWYEQDGMICFEYQNLEEIQCWTFRKGPGGGLVARFQNDPAPLELYEVNRTHEPLQCIGPDVGV